MTNKITIRQFQRDFYNHLEDFPLVVTKNGKDFIVVTLCDDTTTIPNNVVTPVLEEKDDVVTNKRQLSPPSKSKLLPIGKMCKHGLTYHEGCHS